MSEVNKWEGKILPEHHLSYAFTCGETNYFQFTDPINVACERVMDAMQVIQEFDAYKADREFMKAHFEAKKNIYSKDKINIFDLKKLDDQLEERLQLAIPPRRILENMCGIYYFDETENPYKWDRAYTEKKKEAWRKGPVTVSGKPYDIDFFLLSPILSLISSSGLSEDNIPMYLKIASQVDSQQVQTLLPYLSLEQRRGAMFKQHESINTGAKTSVLQ